MTDALTTNSKSKRTPGRKAAVGRLFVLELSGGRIHSMNPDGSDRKVIVTDCRIPDGIAVDVEAGHIYWTNMGVPNLQRWLHRARRSRRKEPQVIVPPGGTFTPKQIQLDKKNGKLYWCDREGMRVMRCEPRRLAGRNAGRDRPWRRAIGAMQTRWCVGITIDPDRRTHLLDAKRPGQRRARPHLSRRNRNPEGRDRRRIAPTSRCSSTACRSRSISSSICKNRVLYWTDRGDPPRGNTVNRAPIDAKPPAPEIVLTHLMEGIGIALDVPGDRMFVTDFAGSVYSAKLDGSGERNFLYAQGNLTGIAYAEI